MPYLPLHRLCIAAALCALSAAAMGADTTATSAAADPATTAPVKAKAPDIVGLFQMHYENRVKSFREQNQMIKNVVLLGDSITEGFDINRYLPGRRVLNRGIGADVIGNNLSAEDKRGVLKRLSESVFDCAPTDVFILIGINDLGQGHSPQVIEEGYRDMLQKIRERLPQVQLHLQSLLPTRDRHAKHNANIIDVNQRIQRLAGEFNCDYIDLYTPMVDEKGELKQNLTKDGLHITEDGYKIWKEILLRKLNW